MTQEELKALLHYDPDTGIFTWKGKRCKFTDNVVAGNINRWGYVMIRTNKRNYSAHRLAWLYIHGCFPKSQLDHINRIRSDNRLCNLREATNSENMQNASMRKDNTSGFMGVYYHKKAKKWAASIAVNCKSKYLGLFATKEEAYEAYLKAKRDLHKFQPVPLECHP